MTVGANMFHFCADPTDLQWQPQVVARKRKGKRKRKRKRTMKRMDGGLSARSQRGHITVTARGCR